MPKQLSLSERIVIERMISKDYSFASIGRNLERSALLIEFLSLARMIVLTKTLA